MNPDSRVWAAPEGRDTHGPLTWYHLHPTYISCIYHVYKIQFLSKFLSILNGFAAARRLLQVYLALVDVEDDILPELRTR